MVLKAEVVEAFAALGITTDTDQVTATKAYKRLALIHHPDRNHGDPTATQRFQQIGAAWNICQRHFDNPSWSHVPEPSATGTKHTHGFTYSFSKDDDIPLDEDELREFYMFMFAETLFNRYSRAKGQRYRYERSGHAGAGVSTFSGGFAESQERQARNAERQMREKEEYEKRKRELELEIEEEERERERIAKKLKADEDRQVTALEHAFQAALAGNSSGVQKSVLDYDLDVSAPRKRGKQTRKQDDVLHHDTLLHAAASHCDETLVMFLIERGAKPTTLNKNKLTPFHAAIQAGNTRVVRFIMERRGKSFEGYHPSKAAPSGRTPLQLAIESRVPAMVELLVKDATTHDVERCWKSETMSEEIREILRSKKGFIPLEEMVHQDSAPILSKKSLRQQEVAQQKEARIAEEQERAAINRQKKETRAAKRAEKDRKQAATQEEARRKAEMEHQRLEDHRRAQEEMRAKEMLLSAEAEARARDAKARADALAREAESRARAEAESREQASREKKLKEQNEARIHEARERSLAENAKGRAEEANKPAANGSPSQSNLPDEKAQPITSKKALSEEERKELRRAKLKEKRKAKQAQRLEEKQGLSATATGQSARAEGHGSAIPENTAKKPKNLKAAVKDTETMDEHQRQKHEAVLRRRTEQSARDKERHRQMVEQRAKANAQTQADAEPAEYIPLTPVSTHTTRKNVPESPRTPFPSNRKTNLSPPLLVPQANTLSFSESFSIPMEDIQTCVVPDDLFKDERPVPPPRVAQTGPPVQASPTVTTGAERPSKPRSYRYPRRGQTGTTV